jgi:hypothetical protein
MPRPSARIAWISDPETCSCQTGCCIPWDCFLEVEYFKSLGDGGLDAYGAVGT